jgi:hypothetical protein
MSRILARERISDIVGKKKGMTWIGPSVVSGSIDGGRIISEPAVHASKQQAPLSPTA